MRTVVDPRFSGLLGNLMMARGYSQADLARDSHISPAQISLLLGGKRNPSDQTAQALDTALAAGGKLAALVAPAGTDADLDRVAAATLKPRDVNVATVTSLAAVLAAQRHLDDTMGSAALLAPVLAQLDTVTTLVREASGHHRPALMRVAAEWAQFCGWLHASVGKYEPARHWFGRALEWATEAGDTEMIATLLSYQGHVAWLTCQWGPTVGLSNAALRDPHVYPGQRAYDAFQCARGHAAMGQLDDAKLMLARADDLAAETAVYTGDVPPWQYYRAPWFWRLERGLAYRYMARWDAVHAATAVAELQGGVDEMPAALRGADWAAEYLVHLSAVRFDAGDPAGARQVLAQARGVAEATRSSRILQLVAQRERVFS